MLIIMRIYFMLSSLATFFFVFFYDSGNHLIINDLVYIRMQRPIRIDSTQY